MFPVSEMKESMSDIICRVEHCGEGKAFQGVTPFLNSSTVSNTHPIHKKSENASLQN